MPYMMHALFTPYMYAGPYDPDGSCLELGGMPVWDDACIVHAMTASQCSQAGGTAVRRAQTQTECAEIQGCFDEDWGVNTAVGQSSCTNADTCDPERYEWKNLLKWTPGVWVDSKMTSAGIHWKARALEKQNVWSNKVSMDSLSELIDQVMLCVTHVMCVSVCVCTHTHTHTHTNTNTRTHSLTHRRTHALPPSLTPPTHTRTRTRTHTLSLTHSLSLSPSLFLSPSHTQARYSMAAEAFKTEFKCENEPLYAILEKVACACGTVKTAVCAGLIEVVPAASISSQTLFSDVETQHITTALGMGEGGMYACLCVGRGGDVWLYSCVCVCTGYIHAEVYGSYTHIYHICACVCACMFAFVCMCVRV